MDCKDAGIARTAGPCLGGRFDNLRCAQCTAIRQGRALPFGVDINRARYVRYLIQHGHVGADDEVLVRRDFLAALLGDFPADLCGGR
jgi:hypothetical protein